MVGNQEVGLDIYDRAYEERYVYLNLRFRTQVMGWWRWMGLLGCFLQIGVRRMRGDGQDVGGQGGIQEGDGVGVEIGSGEPKRSYKL